MQELAKGFEQLLNFDGDVESVYQRNFTFDEECMGVTRTIELKPNGADIPLTNENRKGFQLFLNLFYSEYVSLYVDYILNKSIESQFKAFQTGFWDVTGGEALKVLY